MAPRSPTPGYRIGPIPSRPTVRPDLSTRWARALGIVAVGLLVGFVVVVNQGVERGQQIRAALDAPTVAGMGVARLSRR